MKVYKLTVNGTSCLYETVDLLFDDARVFMTDYNGDLEISSEEMSREMFEEIGEFQGW